MTVQTEIRKAGPFAGNGAADSFPFAFKVFRPEDVRVVRRDAFGAEGDVSYGLEVRLNADQEESPGGTVVLEAPLAAGERLVILSAVPNTQPMEVTNQGGFYPEVLNDSADRAVILVQQVAEEVGRAVKTQVTSEATPDDLLSSLLSSSAEAAREAARAREEADRAKAEAAEAARLFEVFSQERAEIFDRLETVEGLGARLGSVESYGELPQSVAQCVEVFGKRPTMSDMAYVQDDSRYPNSVTVYDIQAIGADGALEWSPDPVLRFSKLTSYEALPIGSVIHSYAAAPPEGFSALNGALLSRVGEYALLWEWAQANSRVVTEGAWAASERGAFSSGDGATTFRVPDLRSLFLRTLYAGRALGSVQGDAIRNITGETNAPNGSSTSGSDYFNASGAFYFSGYATQRGNSGDYGYGGRINFDASRVVPTASENRPVNAALCLYIKHRDASAPEPGRSPFVGEDGNWREYDVASGLFVDTGVAARGPQGVSGPQGPVGATGPSGPQGARGPAGPQGVQGPQGVKGEQGGPGIGITYKDDVETYADLPASGASEGDAWFVRADGLIYIYGESGFPPDGGGIQYRGPAGPQGIQGPQGAPGETGPQGQAGEQGAVGATGPSGPQGMPGERGEKGDAGADGTVIAYRATLNTPADLPTEGLAVGYAYYVRENGQMYLCQGVSPVSWVATPWRGPQGPAGEKGEQGEKGDTVGLLLESDASGAYALASANPGRWVLVTT